MKVIDNGHVEIIMRQTNYDKVLATKKLMEWDGNFMNVIREYINPSFQKKKEKKNKSVQQNVISEIRKFMDNVSLGYEERKEKKENDVKKQEELKKNMLKMMKKKKMVINELNRKKKLDPINE
tara:strand:+ start:860 stop:1228 length:369 start_codon:yes stop_codon:yes gene_type:complete